LRYIIVVEGSVEKTVYKEWIKVANPRLEYRNSHFDLPQNSFAIIDGGGYPHYYQTIEDTIDDIGLGAECDQLIIAVDSDELTVQEKFDEVKDVLRAKTVPVAFQVIVQNACIETWALGNRRAISSNPHTKEFRQIYSYYDVRKNDPEKMVSEPGSGLTKSQFALKYLILALREKYDGVAYSKRNPLYLKNSKYFLQLKIRQQSTAHIHSFKAFIDTFVI
jgi:hypothetical protein